ncbi:hypothetical protein SAPIO_CDS0361 [Scedosporium apiospermum]|uniref:Major facilitator superfamily (MFS) profile domain-containing protein n=1 Tax=Pseudallescheria apiosperma TaxID=563466 RepID=A0A084GGV3_PSEDA|nr:uncharacterized protein SAPIO_CDS0361 [Scedosporium apiospermum]KEZ46565.1 hypothetical protein SAPIO_CDS0361 [Scedosporium apiospermum]
MGPILGPACGGWMSERASWRWTCWVPAICAAVLEIVAFFFLRETYIPTLLKWKLTRLKRNDRNNKRYTVLDLAKTSPEGHILSDLASATARPVMYLALDPALLLLSVYFSCIFGVLYLVVVTFSFVFGKGYGHSAGIVGIDLLAEGVGAMIGMFATTKLLNAIYSRQMKKEGKPYKAESRLVAGFPGALLVAIGLFIYGFTALKTHFIVVGITSVAA